MSPFARSIRASRYRRLAILETDDLKAATLRRLAHEAECGLLRSVGRTDHLRALPAAIPAAALPFTLVARADVKIDAS
jgi:hypothetical protein